MSEIYLGNPNLKKANTQIEFTQENIEEYLKCKEDPVYFAMNYVKIVTLDEGLKSFAPYDFQEKLINNFHDNRFNICKMPRQTGKSTTVISYLLHYVVFNDSVNVGILANKAATARMDPKYWQHLPLQVQLEVCLSTFFFWMSSPLFLIILLTRSLPLYILLLLLVKKPKS